MPNPNIVSYDQFTEEDRSHIRIISNTIYQHKSLHLNYTTYDMLDSQDKVYQRRYPDVMVLSDDKEHPYMYGRVVNLFHTQVVNEGPNALPLSSDNIVMVQMAWVRWFKLDDQPGPQGFSCLRYPSVSFYEGHHSDAFSFIHPDEIIRAVHLIPRFSHGQTAEYINVPTKARPDSDDQDWKHFSVNMYVDAPITLTTNTHMTWNRLVDWDMFMHFRGGGVGHTHMRHIEPWLDRTGWGTTWPSLDHREPAPPSNTQDTDDNNVYVARGNGSFEAGVNSDSGGETGEDSDSEDNNEGDIERPEDENDDLDEDGEVQAAGGQADGTEGDDGETGIFAFASL